VQLVAGEARVDFGEGEVTRRILIQIAGRAIAATDKGPVPVAEIATRAAREHLDRTVRHLDAGKHVEIQSYCGKGDPALIHTAEAAEITANDTSFGCSHWPLSGLEGVVLETCEHINKVLIDEFAIGEDVKVMGLRQEGKIRLTCAVPFLALEVRDRQSYDALKGQVRQAIFEFAKSMDARTETVSLNCADLEGSDVFLTLTGTGAERADDGSVGRGNRANGLITPFRSVSLEAACGKNPISHVGKIYNVLANEVSKRIVREVEEVAEATVYILSQIGKPLDRPLVASATVRTHSGEISDRVRGEVRRIVDDHIARVGEISEAILQGAVRLF
jgi:S-adenosylmethionine synthetase